MSKPKVTTSTVKVSRLGCMRKSTVISNDNSRSVEHVEVWVPEDGDLAEPEEKQIRSNKKPTSG
jgi:hypothetical protein